MTPLPDFTIQRDAKGNPVPQEVLSITDASGHKKVLYAAWPKQVYLHSVTTPNFLLEGERGTGKSTCLRWDCHLKALAFPGYKYLILRRTMGELRKSHLTPSLLPREMDLLGGRALGMRTGHAEALYPNGSIGMFGHCETEQDIEKYLSTEYYLIVFDEIVTFPWDWITRISTSCRVPDGPEFQGLTAMVRGGTNPLGVSAEEVNRYYRLRDITLDEDPEYIASDWGSLHMTMDDNPSLNKTQYLKRFQGIPEAYRKAWLLGEWGIEGAYFSVEPRHIINAMPVIAGPPGAEPQPALGFPWIDVYRIFDYGWHDPSFCLWVAVLPDGREIPFHEEMWTQVPIQKIAADIKQASDGMKIITTIADPTLWDGEKEMGHSLADEFENAGIPLTKAKNSRTAGPLAVQEHLNSEVVIGMRKERNAAGELVDVPVKSPKLIIYENGPYGCPILIRALRAMRVDKKRPGRMADHKMDHGPVCLGYFCMAGVPPTRIPYSAPKREWMQPAGRRRLGSEGVRKSA